MASGYENPTCVLPTPEQQKAIQPWLTLLVVARLGKLLPQAALVIGSFFVRWLSLREGVVLFFGLEIGGRYVAFFAERAMAGIVGREGPGWPYLLGTTEILAALFLVYFIQQY